MRVCWSPPAFTGEEVGGSWPQAAERRAIEQCRGNVLDVGRHSWLAQSEALSEGDADCLHHVRHVFVLDAFGDNHGATDAREGHGRVDDPSRTEPARSHGEAAPEFEIFAR